MGINALGIDIGTFEVNCIEGSFFTRSQYKIGHFAKSKSAVPFDLLSESFIDEFVDFFKRDFKNQFKRNRHVNYVIDDKYILTREISLPTIKLSEIENLVYSEAPNHFPVDLAEYIIQYRILSRVQSEYERLSKIQISIMPRKIVEQLIKVSHLLHFKPHIIDSQENVLAKLNATNELFLNQKLIKKSKTEKMIIKNGSINNTANLYLDLGHKSSSFHIISNDTTLLQRSFDFAMDEIYLLISSKYDKSREQASLVVEQYLNFDVESSDNPLINEINGLVREQFVLWLDDINRLIRFHASKENSIAIDKAILIGGGLRSKGFQTFLEKSLGISSVFMEVADYPIFKTKQSIPNEYIYALASHLRRRK